MLDVPAYSKRHFQYMHKCCDELFQFLKSSEPSVVDEENKTQLEQFEEEKVKLLKAWRTFLVVCSSYQVRNVKRHKRHLFHFLNLL